MQPVIHAYKLRLTNLSQSNRSLKLGTLSARKDLDLCTTGFINKLSTEEVLSRIVAGKPVDLIKALNARDEATNLLDRRLNNIYHEVEMIRGESGADDLFVGYPFVEGKFLDGSIARCPVMLFPVRLERNFEGGTRWRLTCPEDASVVLNKTFFLAFEKFMEMRLPKEFWEEEFEHQENLQDFLNLLYKFIQSFELPLNFNSTLFQFNVAPFENKNAAALEQLPMGMLRFQPNAVMGIFPQSDSALLQDYEQIERRPEQFPLASLLSMQSGTKHLAPPKEDERFLVTPVDQSQEEVLMMVRAGNSVVVHGPPGTGKSQVILNLIADALAQGQRVLVCSQKRAALDVVYQRMAELGLSQFAALVHDFRGDRNKIFKHIAKQVEQLENYREAEGNVLLDKWLRDFRLDARRLDELNRYFEDLNTALTQPGRFGLNAHQLYLLADANIPALPLQEEARALDYPALRQLVERFRDLAGYLPLYSPAHPWRHRHSMHSQGFSNKANLLASVAALPAELEALNAAWLPNLPLALAPDHFPEAKECISQWEKLAEEFSQAQTQQDFAAFQADGQNISPYRRVLERFESLGNQMGTFKALDDFPLNLFDDLQERVGNYRKQLGSPFRFLSLDWHKGRWYVHRILKRKGIRLDEKGWKLFAKEFKTLEAFIAFWKSQDGLQFFQDIPLLEGAAELVEWCRRKHQSLDAIKAAKAYKGPVALHPKSILGEFDLDSWKGSTALIASLKAYLRLVDAQLQKWKPWLHTPAIEALLAHVAAPAQAAPIISSLQESLARDHDRMRDHDQFVHSWTPVERQCLDQLEPELRDLKQGPSFDAFVKRIENSILLQWMQVMEAETPSLPETSSPRMGSMRQLYLDKVKERQESAVSLIQARLRSKLVASEAFNRLGNPVTYREIARQVQKQRRIWPLRRLIAETWDEGLARLMPCWLGSPESVAAIFPMEAGFFDLVVFDEASQCYVERSIPVILRGKTSVVAGDDKQLQPFDLYNVKVEDAEGAFLENEMAMEVESALDLCKNVFPEAKLMWHYRSREQELIQFSNHAFYDGRLNVMPPAAPDHDFQPPLEFLRVEGKWENNQNVVEAKTILDLLEKLVLRKDRPSIGIVTFNHPQMMLIREMLDARLDSLGMAFDLELREKMRAAMQQGEGEERQGLFIKNIENVQGDERDVIIFSVGYAKNAAGKLVANFGLLNQRGGGNRLNVAVTRARRKVYVVCSFDPSDLAVEQAAHDGPRLLKRYLEYARDVSDGRDHTQLLAGKEAQPHNASASAGNELAARLAVMLCAKGLEVDEAVGGTAFKVDLAVKDGKGGYRLGIECEGSVYFSGRSSKEREVYRWRLLEKNGWRMHRVWARSFFLDPGAVVDEIMGKLK